MYSFVRSTAVAALLSRHLPIVVVCFLIAETFYKFRSFTLETLAFFATWFVLDLVVEKVSELLRKRCGKDHREAHARKEPGRQGPRGPRRAIRAARGVPCRAARRREPQTTRHRRAGG
jgi:hypothetical protein